MDYVVNKYIDMNGHSKWLVKAILQLIDEDRAIPDTAFFRIKKAGGYTHKAELRTLPGVSIQSFLLGMWAYIIVNIRNNTVGKETYYRWFPSARETSNGSRHEFTSDIHILSNF